MRNWRQALATRTGRFALAGATIFALSAPALANHFDFDDLSGPDAAPTAEQTHVECPEPKEGQTPEEATAACDAAVAEVFAELQDYDHPENHGKYVSFVAHCLKDVEGGRGGIVRQIAREKGDDQAELAVKLCAEAQLAPDEESAEAEQKGGKRQKDDAAEEQESEADEGPGQSQGKGQGRDASEDRVDNGKGQGRKPSSPGSQGKGRIEQGS